MGKQEKKNKKIVVVGGGTGTYQVLVGLKKYPVQLSAIVAMSDSGGSTGKLRRELGILPPGDIRRALIALSNLPLAERTLERLFDFRFSKGKTLKGHSVGNLLIAALTQITGRADLAIEEAGKILAVSGYVYPVTLDSNTLIAILENGKKIIGETKIDLRWHGGEDADIPIKKVYLKPKASIYPGAKKALEAADLIVVGPGDLYTSIVPNLLVQGVPEAILKSPAKVALIVNLMTKPGETDNFKASDFVRVAKDYMAQASDKLTYVIVNNDFPDSVRTLAWYSKFASEPIQNDLDSKQDGVRVIKGNFLRTGEFLRHDPKKLARAIIKLVS
ncbi:MAG: YvcK family protein [Candidatus Blackburnbacteria bacterium]|nr:YvcK family protein [Candidatus Blackburnbacteria bacterium]